MSDLEQNLRQMIREIVRSEIRGVIDQAKGDEYLSTRAAAELARVTEKTIRRWIAAGKLAEHRAGRVVRVLRTDLEQMLRSGAPNDNSPEARAARDFG